MISKYETGERRLERSPHSTNKFDGDKLARLWNDALVKLAHAS
jgi:hypothetical protein